MKSQPGISQEQKNRQDHQKFEREKFTRVTFRPDLARLGMETIDLLQSNIQLQL